jgi:hypothetical protein
MMASEGMCVAVGAGLSSSNTILDSVRLQDGVAALWRAESCPTLSREQRIRMIAEAGQAMTRA